MSKAIVVLALLTLGLSCDKKIKDPDCDLLCFVFHSHFNFRLVDETTGEDLLSGPSPRYLPSHLKLALDSQFSFPVPFRADTIIQVVRIHTSGAREKMYLKAGTSIYKLHASFRGRDCCSAEVATLSINEQLICSSCPNWIGIPVK